MGSEDPQICIQLVRNEIGTENLKVGPGDWMRAVLWKTVSLLSELVSEVTPTSFFFTPEFRKRILKIW